MTKISLMVLGGTAAVALASPTSAQQLPEGNGKAVVEKICAACHELSLLTDRGRTREDWAGVVKNMMEMGADIKANEVALITDYLASALPPRQAAAAPSIAGTASASFKEWPLARRGAFPHDPYAAPDGMIW